MRKWKVYKSSSFIDIMRAHNLDIMEKMYEAKRVIKLLGYFTDSSLKLNYTFTSIKEWLIEYESNDTCRYSDGKT